MIKKKEKCDNGYDNWEKKDKNMRRKAKKVLPDNLVAGIEKSGLQNMIKVRKVDKRLQTLDKRSKQCQSTSF